MKVLAIGRSEYLLNAIERVANEHDIVAVVTGPATAESLAKEADFSQMAQRLDAVFHCASTIDDGVLDLCRSVGAEVAISVNWMSVIGASFIELFPQGVLNAHCGDLPDYRGNAILNWAILRGEESITVSAHKMVAGELDVGDIYAQCSFDVAPQDDVGNLVSKLGGVTPVLFTQALSNLAQGRCLRTLQEVKARGGFRCYPRLPIDGCVNWSSSANDIDRLIKASARPYPGAYTCVVQDSRVRKLRLWKSRVVAGVTVDVGVPGHVLRNDRNSGETHVLTGKGVIALQEVQYEGDTLARPAELFRSIRMRFGLSEAALIDLLSSADRRN
jgi:methionyl-tRNA formyltransferase